MLVGLDGLTASEEDGWEGELVLGRVRETVDSEPVGLSWFVCIVAECGKCCVEGGVLTWRTWEVADRRAG